MSIENVANAQGLRNPTDYIPIHTSDRMQFKKCRRRWDWNSPTRQNLVPDRAANGVIFPLWFGTGIHVALEYMYMPERSSDMTPMEVFDEWYQAEWDRLSIEAGQWVDEHAEELEEHHMLGIGMLENYQTYAAEHDNFRVVATEHDFAVPMGMKMYDRRTGKVLPVKYCGRQDLLIQDLETDAYGIMDHKTAASIGEEYFEKLDMDEQCTSYLWAGQQEMIHDPKTGQLIYPSFVLYNVLRKAAPKPPTVNKNGSLSIDRSNESTTYDQWIASVTELNLADTIWYKSERVQMYEEYLRQAGWEQFFERKMVLRNDHEIDSIGEQIKLEAEDMLNLPNIYPNPSQDWYCIKCPFRAPCLATNDGSDVDYILRENYQRNTDR